MYNNGELENDSGGNEEVSTVVVNGNDFVGGMDDEIGMDAGSENIEQYIVSDANGIIIFCIKQYNK